MRAIVVDDEMLMIRRFVRLTADFGDLDIIGQFECAEDALGFARDNKIDVAFIDIKMPVVDGLELASKLKKLRSDLLIVFVTAYDEFIRQSNEIGGDYYIIKPYSRQILENMMKKIRLLARGQEKKIYIRTFGHFTVLKKDSRGVETPVPITGKAKEILAYVVTKRGKEVSNSEIYFTLWPERPYSNENMGVYYNACRRLRKVLADESINDLLISTSRGKMLNTDIADCDYYSWLDNPGARGEDAFEGMFLSEYSWGEAILSELLEYQSFD